MLFVSSATRFFVVASVLWFRVCETIDDDDDDAVVVRNAVDTAVRDNRLNAVDMITVSSTTTWVRTDPRARASRSEVNQVCKMLFTTRIIALLANLWCGAGVNRGGTVM